MNAETAERGQVLSERPGPLTTREAAAVLGLSERAVRRAVRRGELAATKQGGVFQIAPGALARYRENRPRPHPAQRSLRLVPPPRHDPLAGRLPAPLTPLIGREREVAAATRLLTGPQRCRLLVLTGPGGVGKTRLALQVAAAAGGAFGAGVAFIPLAAIRDPALVTPTIAKAVGVHETGDRPLAAQLAAALADKHLLLVLDNFEQLTAAGPVVGELLASSPSLSALVTSRVRLRLSGERAFPVLPLARPEPGETLPE